MKNSILIGLFLAGSVLPAHATLITIDSTNCSKNCYGLAWNLEVIDLGSGNYTATLTVSDDPTDGKTPNPTLVVSAVDFKIASGNGTTSGFNLDAAPGGTSLWTTYANGLNSGGCGSAGSGFLCSQSATAASVTTGPLIWAWHFTTSAQVFDGLLGAHIGAKLTDLNTPGRLLSEEYTPVPEPPVAVLLLVGVLAVLLMRRFRAA